MAGQAFDHLVVLMLENRSFDHMLGRLYHPDNPPPFDVPPRGQIFDGIKDSMSNPVAPAQPEQVYVWRNTDYCAPGDDWVGHQFQDVYEQMNLQGAAPMGGFVFNRRKYPGPETQWRTVMGSFSPLETSSSGSGFAACSILSHLAVNFAVCDNWHCSMPGPTFPNRSFLHSGNSNGLVYNADFKTWGMSRSATIFNLMQEAGLSAAVYHSGEGPTGPDGRFPALVYELHPTVTNDLFPPRTFTQFIADASAGALPNYAFIEPQILGVDVGWQPNDQHPPNDIRIGEALMFEVFLSILSSPTVDRTLLLITYDEHGGFFDHCYPPAAIPPQPLLEIGGYGFDQFGARVPAVLISPFIEAGTIFHPTAPVDHTSILKTACVNWGLDVQQLGDRAAAACDLSSVLGSTRRSLHGLEIVRPEVPPSAPGPMPLTEWQRDYVALIARNRKAELPPLATNEDARAFLKELLPKCPIPLFA